MLISYCRCFLPADIWFLGNPALCEEQSQSIHKIYTGSGPWEASKSCTSSYYSCIACIRRDCYYNVAMLIRESMITTGRIASYLYPGSTYPTS